MFDDCVVFLTKGAWARRTRRVQRQTTKVYALNEQTSKCLEPLAMLYSNFEQICTEKREAEAQFDKDFEESLKKFIFFGLVFCFYEGFFRVFI